MCSGERPNNIHRAPNQTISNMPTPIKSIRDDGKLVTSFSHHYTPHKIHHVEGNARGVATARYWQLPSKKKRQLEHRNAITRWENCKKSLPKKDCNKNGRVSKRCIPQALNHGQPGVQVGGADDTLLIAVHSISIR